MSLNKEADLIANNLDQPFNHELKERIKELYKQEVALIINKLANTGIDRQLVINYEAEIETVDVYIDSYNKKGYKGKAIKTKNKVPSTVRIRKDAPYLYVGSIDRRKAYPYRNPSESEVYASFSPTGESYSYDVVNNYIIINDIRTNVFKGKYILIQDIFENPEEVLSKYDDIDGHDIELPIPNDIKAMVRDRILNTLGQMPIDNENVKSEQQ